MAPFPNNRWPEQPTTALIKKPMVDNARLTSHMQYAPSPAKEAIDRQKYEEEIIMSQNAYLPSPEESVAIKRVIGSFTRMARDYQRLGYWVGLPNGVNRFVSQMDVEQEIHRYKRVAEISYRDPNYYEIQCDYWKYGKWDVDATRQPSPCSSCGSHHEAQTITRDYLVSCQTLPNKLWDNVRKLYWRRYIKNKQIT